MPVLTLIILCSLFSHLVLTFAPLTEAVKRVEEDMELSRTKQAVASSSSSSPSVTQDEAQTKLKGATRADVLVVEAFHCGSHRQLVDCLMKDAAIGPRAQLVTMTGKKWHWRARVSALHLSTAIPVSHSYRVLFTSSVLNLAELVALRPDLGALHKVLYFHENQLQYPVRQRKDRDFQYGYNQIMSCLVADCVLFNSKFNMDSFLSSVSTFLKLMPDYRPKRLADAIRPKCSVLYFPMLFNHIDQCLLMEQNVSLNSSSAQTHFGSASNVLEDQTNCGSDTKVTADNLCISHDSNNSNNIPCNTKPPRCPRLGDEDSNSKASESCVSHDIDMTHHFLEPGIDSDLQPTLCAISQVRDAPHHAVESVHDLELPAQQPSFSCDTEQCLDHPSARLSKTQTKHSVILQNTDLAFSSSDHDQGSKLDSERSRVSCDVKPPDDSADGHKDSKAQSAHCRTALKRELTQHSTAGDLASKQRCEQADLSDSLKPQKETENSPIHIVWPHRWEHDKDPETFFQALFRLHDDGLPFLVSVLGETFSQVPDIFAEAREKLKGHIYTWGYLPDKHSYYTVLKAADVVVSTSKHEFFGVAMLEAVHLSCYPLCPKSLVYPELYPDECLYSTAAQLFKRLRSFCRHPHLARNTSLLVGLQQYSWENLRPQYLSKLQIQEQP